MTHPKIHGLKPYVSASRTYHGGRTYPASYCAAAVREVLLLRRFKHDKEALHALGWEQTKLSAIKIGRDLATVADMEHFNDKIAAGWSDAQILAWVEADERIREAWRRKGHKIGGLRSAATKRSRRKTAAPSPAAPAPTQQPKRRTVEQAIADHKAKIDAESKAEAVGWARSKPASVLTPKRPKVDYESLAEAFVRRVLSLPEKETLEQIVERYDVVCNVVILREEIANLLRGREVPA